MARGVRDGKIFRSPGKEPHLEQTSSLQIREWRRLFRTRNCVLPGDFPVGLSPYWSVRESPPYFVREWRSTFGTKSFGSDPLKSARRPSTDKEVARGCRDGYFSCLCAEQLICGRSRRFATECDALRRCDDLRQNTAHHGVPRQRKFFPTPQMRQLRWVVEHKGNV